eukprot:PhF_6_TR25143/c0_g1_i4/m.34621
MNCITSYFHTIFLDPTLPLEQKWRYAFCHIMTIVWMWILFDGCYELSTSKPSARSLVLKCSNIWLFFTLPFGLTLAYSSKGRHISDKVMTYIVQCTAICLVSSTCIISPTRPTTTESALLMIVIAISTLPRWKLQCLTLVPGMFITSYNASFGINGYPSILVEGYQIRDVTKEFIAHVTLVWMIPIVLVMVRSFSRAYYASLGRLEGAVSVAKRVS